VAVFIRSAIEQTAGDALVRGLIDHEFHPADVGVELVVNEPVPAWAQEPLPGARGLAPVLHTSGAC
jgi:hypothetical protein